MRFSAFGLGAKLVVMDFKYIPLAFSPALQPVKHPVIFVNSCLSPKSCSFCNS